MELAPHIPIERCHLVKYNFMKDIIEQSFDLDKVYYSIVIIIFIIIFSFRIKLLDSLWLKLDIMDYS